MESIKITEKNVSETGVLPNCWEQEGGGEKPKEEEISRAMKWIVKFCTKRDRIDKERTSYSFKHAVEEWSENELHDPQHISNGAFIVAALRCGYRLNHEGGNSPNAWINMGTKFKWTKA
jgi:hypothetical protein